MEREGTNASNEKTYERFYFFLLTRAFYLSDYLFCISKRISSSRTINNTFCVLQGIYSEWLCEKADLLRLCAAVPPPPPFLFTLTGEGTANVNYEKARYHITQLKKRFFFDNLYARMITLILVFLITETGLLQNTSSL